MRLIDWLREHPPPPGLVAEPATAGAVDDRGASPYRDDRDPPITITTAPRLARTRNDPRPVLATGLVIAYSALLLSTPIGLALFGATFAADRVSRRGPTRAPTRREHARRLTVGAEHLDVERRRPTRLHLDAIYAFDHTPGGELRALVRYARPARHVTLWQGPEADLAWIRELVRAAMAARAPLTPRTAPSG